MTTKYTIRDTFIITGRGLVLAGTIEEGMILTGDYIEFDAFGKKRKRKITGVSAMRKADDEAMKTDLVIECENENEMGELRRWRPMNEVGIITKE
jgi:translation elongation factor EF-Tu-like GTPase